jgi:hypothetical protein
LPIDEPLLRSRRQNGQDGFAPASRYRIPEVDDALVAADLNNDGKLDVLTSDGQILPGNGDETLNYTTPETCSSTPPAHLMRTGWRWATSPAKGCLT